MRTSRNRLSRKISRARQKRSLRRSCVQERLRPLAGNAREDEINERVRFRRALHPEFSVSWHYDGVDLFRACQRPGRFNSTSRSVSPIPCNKPWSMLRNRESDRVAPPCSANSSTVTCGVNRFAGGASSPLQNRLPRGTNEASAILGSTPR